jgi:hypothetical protein
MSLNKEEFIRDRPFWKFNSSLLFDKEFVQSIKKMILDVKTQYALPVYNLNKIDDIPNSEVQFKINDQLFFEVLLMEIRGKCISYASYKKKRDSKEEDDLLKKIQLLENNVSETNVQELERAKSELEVLRKRKVDGIVIRSRVKWINEGEKVSNYFCNLENRNFLDKAMHCIERESGDIITNQQDILLEAKQFYQYLYDFRPTEEINLNEHIHDHPILSEENKNQIEGLLSYNAAANSLRKMKNDKSPGPDGFTTNFFKFFFRDIGDFLVRSINYGFLNDSLSVTQRQGVITCIPKDGKPKRFLKNWRPISLLNVSYKIASACIAERLKTVLPSIIHKCQNGFLKGRYIGDNIRLIYDILTYTESEEIPGLLLMIDFEKAFDSVSWSFLHKALQFFNFGPMMCHWVKLFYSGINSCISLNGQYSAWFPIQRGVRQGDPSSPYLYLICAEILSLMIRQNDRIKGIKLRASECLLSQFADDTTLSLDGSEESFNEAIETLINFSKISGLKMNTQKTQVVWIGSRKNSNVQYRRDQNFVWNPGIFRVLGVNFSTNIQTICELNFNDKLLTIQRCIKTWKKRHLTPLGKITIIKSLLMSKLTHLLISLPDPSEQFIAQLEKEYYDFLWDGKAKIKKTVVCKSYREGGIQMLDIRMFITTLKLSWLRKLRIESDWRDFTFNLYPELSRLEKIGGEYANVVMKSLENCFWRDVMKHYKKLYAKCQIISTEEFCAECIHYNVNILREKKVVFVKEWYDAGILYVRQLLKDNGTFMNFNDFRTKYPAILRTNFLMFEGIMTSIKRYCEKVQVNLLNNTKILETKAWFTISRNNKYILSILSKTETLPTAVERWNEIFNNINFNWSKIFLHCIKTTPDVQLRWFQLRLIHRCLPTEKYLNICKIVDSPNCTFCQLEEENIQHLMWKCPVVHTFWVALLDYIKEKCFHANNLNLSETLVLFGICDGTVTDRGLDNLLIWAKFYIYKSKLQKVIPEFKVFMSIVKYRINMEKYLSLINNNSNFNSTWDPYLSLIN